MARSPEQLCTQRAHREHRRSQKRDYQGRLRAVYCRHDRGTPCESAGRDGPNGDVWRSDHGQRLTLSAVGARYHSAGPAGTFPGPGRKNSWGPGAHGWCRIFGDSIACQSPSAVLGAAAGFHCPRRMRVISTRSKRPALRKGSLAEKCSAASRLGTLMINTLPRRVAPSSASVAPQVPRCPDNRRDNANAPPDVRYE